MIDDDFLEFRIRFSSQRKQTRLLGKMITLIGDHLGLDAKFCFELEIAVVEALNNAIIHAYADQSNQRLDLEISCRPDTITITLSDQGACFDYFSKPPCPVPDNAPIEELPESGFGLYLIHQVMDQVVYSSQTGINTLTMKKHLPTGRDDELDRI